MDAVFINKQLDMLGIRSDGIQILQDKSGVTVARTILNGNPVIVKCFEDAASRREITNYRLLNELGVPTLKVIAVTDAALVMEDIALSESSYRLACEADMANVHAAEKLAAWYRKLHDSGREYVVRHGGDMYSEAGLFTRENIGLVMDKSGTRELPVWRLIGDNFEKIRAFIDSVPMTLTYNDFYYTNMAVARDGSSAIMFDYNLLGKGHVYSDMRNVQYSLSPDAAAAFEAAYGEHDFEKEKLTDDVVSQLVTLYMAYQRTNFPEWARESLEHIKYGYIGAVEGLLMHI